MRVSLAPTHLRAPPDAGRLPERAPRDLLAPTGPRVILGGDLGADGLAQAIVPAADTLFGPRGACLAAPQGPLFVCDTGHHRLMVWRGAPTSDRAPADLLVGQPDFSRDKKLQQGLLDSKVCWTSEYFSRVC